MCSFFWYVIIYASYPSLQLQLRSKVKFVNYWSLQVYWYSFTSFLLSWKASYSSNYSNRYRGRTARSAVGKCLFARTAHRDRASVSGTPSCYLSLGGARGNADRGLVFKASRRNSYYARTMGRSYRNRCERCLRPSIRWGTRAREARFSSRHWRWTIGKKSTF